MTRAKVSVALIVLAFGVALLASVRSNRDPSLSKRTLTREHESLSTPCADDSDSPNRVPALQRKRESPSKLQEIKPPSGNEDARLLRDWLLHLSDSELRSLVHTERLDDYVGSILRVLVRQDASSGPSQEIGQFLELLNARILSVQRRSLWSPGGQLGGNR